MFINNVLNFICKGCEVQTAHNSFLRCFGAPSIANSFITKLEKDMILNPNINPFLDNIFFIKCFLDDLFLLFRDPGKINAFIDWMNNLTPSIEFTCSYDQHKINFLFLNFSDRNTLGVKVHRKPTVHNSLLHYNPFLP